MHAAVIPASFRPVPDKICAIIRFFAERGADPDPIDDGGRTPISIADIWPVEQASRLLYELTVQSGKTPKILPTDLR